MWAEHLYLLVRYLGSLLSLSSLRTCRSMRALFKERKKKRWTKYYQKKRENFSIYTINIQHDTHSLSWWSRGTGLSSWSRRTLVKVSHKFMWNKFNFIVLNTHFHKIIKDYYTEIQLITQWFHLQVDQPLRHLPCHQQDHLTPKKKRTTLDIILISPENRDFIKDSVVRTIPQLS